MLTPEQNRLLTETGRGTPGGELLRRYWQPAALSAELPLDGAPLPIRLLGEDLVLFRDDDGLPGLLGIHCTHRGADLSYGRLEGGCAACTTAGCTTATDGAWSSPANRPAAPSATGSASRPTRASSGQASSSPIWGPESRHCCPTTSLSACPTSSGS